MKMLISHFSFLFSSILKVCLKFTSPLDGATAPLAPLAAQVAAVRRPRCVFKWNETMGFTHWPSLIKGSTMWTQRPVNVTCRLVSLASSWCELCAETQQPSQSEKLLIYRAVYVLTLSDGHETWTRGSRSWLCLDVCGNLVEEPLLLR